MADERKMENILTAITVTLLFTGVLAYECGPYKFTNLAVGGTNVTDPSDWPWIVGLFHQGESSTSFQCGATLVSRHLVVTAAHCVSEDGFTLPGSEITLVMGTPHIRNWTQQKSVQIRNVMHVMVHPSYIRSPMHGADLAVLELDSPIDVTETVTPVCVWNKSSDRMLTGRNGTVIVWGRDENNKYNNPVTETLRRIQLPIVDKQICLQSNPNFFNFANNYTFCTGNRDGTGPCNGDSGSGMFVLRTRQDGTKSWVLRGIASRVLQASDGSGFCDLSNFIVFTDMAKIKLNITASTLKYSNMSSSLEMIEIGEKHYFFEFALNENNVPHTKVSYTPFVRVTRLIPPSSPQMLNWTSAQQFCRSHGLQLASVETRLESDLIAEHIKGRIPSDFSTFILWLGGSDAEQEGTWRWTSGQTINYTDWWRGQPNNEGGNQHCLAMVVWRNGINGWSDETCSRKKRFICELENVYP